MSSTANHLSCSPGTRLEGWFQQRAWTVFDFQRTAWHAWLQGQSGIIHSPTGSGKTMAAWGGPLQHLLDNPALPGLRLLWITPLRALAADTAKNLNTPLTDLQAGWQVAIRTGDTSSYQKQKLRRQPPRALVTTPESLALMLSYVDAYSLFRRLDGIVVDEWHELMDSKRGVLLQLCLARLRGWCPRLRTWGVSATLANLDTAADMLLGMTSGSAGRIVQGMQPKNVQVDSLLPADIGSFPWSGHLGLKQLRPVLEAIEQARTTLLFTNTRSQAELWHQAIDSVMPGAAEQLGLHHGSLDRDMRQTIEQRLASGQIRCVVATSSLDLGVDFSSIEQVIQIGSPKGAARLLQRAGRSGHRPGDISRVICVPTHALEMLEISAARHAIEQQQLESRQPYQLSLDVLAQHLVSCALSGDDTGKGFEPNQLLTEIQGSHAYRHLSSKDWRWVLTFITQGGAALSAYPNFHKVVRNPQGRYVVTSKRIAMQHRMAIGTITCDGVMGVQFVKGKKLGYVEESFIARLKPGERFLFAGRSLELKRVRDMTAYVKTARGKDRQTPRWMGGRMPLSALLSDAVLACIDSYARTGRVTPELQCLQPLLQLQQQRSALPSGQHLLIEQTNSREGHHLYLFPYAGRLAHEGLAMLLAWRISQAQPTTFSFSANDYGFELLSRQRITADQAAWREWLSTDQLQADIKHSLNATEMARRHFRDIARIAGLVFPGRPGKHKSMRQIQASSGLIFDVLRDYEPHNRLLQQASQEAFERELDFNRLRNALLRIQAVPLRLMSTERLSPFAFPLWADRLRGQLSSEDWATRTERMLARISGAA